MTGQIADAHPGQDQKPAVADDPLQVRLAPALVPTDPLVAGPHAPGPTGILQATDDRSQRVFHTDEVAQVRTEGDPVAQVMITFHQLPPQGPFLDCGNQRERKAGVVTQSSFQRFAPGPTRGSIHAGFRSPWPPGSALWQFNERSRFEPLQKLPALDRLKTPVASVPVE